MALGGIETEHSKKIDKATALTKNAGTGCTGECVGGLEV